MQWIIVDDGQLARQAAANVFTWERSSQTEVVQLLPLPSWEPGQNTLVRNLLAALPVIAFDKILFFEDDDWYSPRYIETMLGQLQHADIVGEAPARYYHVPSRRYWKLSNSVHASLCQTGIRSDLLPIFENVLHERKQEFIDVRLWQECRQASQVLTPTELSVGIKGLPGRPGIGIGHRPDRSPKNWKADPKLTVFRDWLGTDADLYKSL
jgi:hypothetical protein